MACVLPWREPDPGAGQDSCVSSCRQSLCGGLYQRDQKSIQANAGGKRVVPIPCSHQLFVCFFTTLSLYTYSAGYRLFLSRSANINLSPYCQQSDTCACHEQLKKLSEDFISSTEWGPKLFWLVIFSRKVFPPSGNFAPWGQRKGGKKTTTLKAPLGP